MAVHSKHRKLVHNVTLFPEVAEGLRPLSDSLSGGIAVAYDLLKTVGVIAALETIRTIPSTLERKRLETDLYQRLSAAARLSDALAQVAPHNKKPVGNPFDDPFDDEPTETQLAFMSQRMPMVEDELDRSAIESVESIRNQEAGAAESVGHDPGSTEPAVPASTADSSVANDPGRSELEGVAEPQF